MRAPQAILCSAALLGLMPSLSCSEPEPSNECAEECQTYEVCLDGLCIDYRSGAVSPGGGGRGSGTAEVAADADASRADAPGRIYDAGADADDTSDDASDGSGDAGDGSGDAGDHGDTSDATPDPEISLDLCAQLVVSPNPWRIGSVASGTRASARIRNTSEVTFTVVEVSVTARTAFSVISPRSAPGVLESGETMSVIVEVVGLEGRHDATLTVEAVPCGASVPISALITSG